MIFQVKSYLKFLWNSNNEHGIHSPFVFNLVTKCLYDKKELKKHLFEFSIYTHKNKILNRIFHYFNFKNGIFIPENNIVHFSQNLKVDYIFISSTYMTKNKVALPDLLSQSNNDTCFIFDSIYNSVKENLFWKKVVQNPSFTVTIDTYSFGLAFLRKEQQKEHFVIRI